VITKQMPRPTKRLRRAVAQLFAPEQRPTGAKITRNVAFSGLRGLLVWPVPFLVIPFALKHVGLVGYGTWAVCLTITRLTALADPGVGGAITKYVAQHDAVHDTKALTRLVDTGLMLYLLIALAIVLIFGAMSGILIPVLFKGSSALGSELLFAWRCTLIIAAANLLAVPFGSIIVGVQRMDLTNALSALNTLASALLLVVLLLLGLGLRGLFYAYLAASLLTLLLSIWSAHRLLPDVTFNPLRFEYSEARKIMSFSIQLYVTGLAVTISTEIEKLYLTWFTGVVPVGWYDVASQVALRVRRIPEMLLSPILAAASELDAKGEHEKLRELYYRAHKYTALIAAPLCFYVFIIAHRLVKLWIGPKFPMVGTPLAVLAAANLFNLVSGPGLLTLIGKGILKPGLHSALLGICLNLTLSFWLIHSYGFTGSVIGTAAAIAIATLFFLGKFTRLEGSFSAKSAFRAYLRPLFVSAVLSLVFFILKPFDNLGSAGLIIESFVFGCVYLAGLTLTGFFDAFDLNKVEGHLRLPAYIKRFIPVA
jgi:O-antigen/teichoic acid export membrane protein